MNNKGNRLPESVAIDRCNELGLIFVGTYVKNYGTRVQYICPKHEDEGIQESLWGHFRTAKYACKYCCGNTRKNAEILQRELNEMGMNVTIIGEYVNSHTKIKYKCNACGEEHEAKPTLLLHGRGCPTCGRAYNTMVRTKTHDQFVKELACIQPNIGVIGRYKHTHALVRCKCSIDGTEWEAYPANLLNMSSGCPICRKSVSLGEQAVMRCLNERNIEYNHNHTFKDCKRVGLLRFDFYLPKYNTVIEFDGRQHYMEVPRFTGSGGFKLTVERDMIKDKYCEDHGIRMIRIPYYDINKVETIIDEKLINTA